MEDGFRLVVLLILGLIIVALAQGMWFLARDSGRTERTRVAIALTARIALSLFLFALLMFGGLAGWLDG